jgi:hypothetical protein
MACPTTSAKTAAIVVPWGNRNLFQVTSTARIATTEMTIVAGRVMVAYPRSRLPIVHGSRLRFRYAVSIRHIELVTSDAARGWEEIVQVASRPWGRNVAIIAAYHAARLSAQTNQASQALETENNVQKTIAIA